ncbi:MAG: flavin reductase family protein [Sulfuricurvum sp.]|nr:flavin reductase family protein [Sulfuricurvum sp.]
MLIPSDYFTSPAHYQPRIAILVGCQDNLMALSWHMPISKSPFRYAIGVREENMTHTMLLEYRSCTLNFLPFSSYEAIDICGRAHGGDKLADSGLTATNRDKNGNMIIDESDTVFACDVIDTYQNGDHTLFILEIQETYINISVPSQPTLFFGQGCYATITNNIRANKPVV